MSKLWGGRFEGATDRLVEEFTASIGVDARLWEVDVRCSIAHARMLGGTGILPEAEARALVAGLEALGEELRSRFERGEAVFRPEAEDVHSEIERLLTERIGAVAGKLHTGRSRNDQVATDTRLYLRERSDALAQELHGLESWLVGAAEQHLQTVLPGLTHTQHAQPVSLAHHLLAYFWMFERDRERLADCRRRLDVLPLGSAALAGTSFPLDREQVARELGFGRVSENSLDAVSDRDFVVEFLGAASLIMMHLSRLAEELILWSTPEFGFIELSDAVTTGSSIMPQKKNPDVAELIRGRTGRVNGALVAALTMLKALPLAYNRDLQEDKAALFDGLDTAHSCVRLMTRMLRDARFRTERMARACESDYSNATDLADFLVEKGVPFRQCHEIAGRMVRDCLERGIGLEAMPLERMREFSPHFDETVHERIRPRVVMAARASQGGTAPAAVAEQLRRAHLLV
ncbi:MAG: argininosuccinate lyase [Oligoflexia bacterium]|nr:argininosuccinate lyase [Oligoflexia bacterium]